MKFESRIPLSDQEKSAFIEAIYNAHKNDIRDFILEYDLETQNCIHFLRWDFTNTNIIRKFQGQRFQCLKVKRGPWKFVLIYDRETMFLYSLMRDKRFGELQDRTSRQRVHYADALASHNQSLEDVSDVERFLEQDLFDMDGAIWADEVQEVLKELTANIEGEVKYYSVITFSSEKDEITSVSAYIPTASLGIAFEENWNEHITADFTNTYTTSGISTDSEDEDIHIGLREGIIPQQEEDLVQPREDEKEKDNEE
ncbi:DUF5986 family protein [Paenibacillus sp. FSL H8-0034]|uniref:DUF5986 family protein n=1 Tax=Paenibacillus sp. FSL H8-0034 TaxID=2954671 RepID=UPI0030F7DA5F